MKKILNNSSRYGRLSTGLHWLMLLLIIGVYTCMWLSEAYPNGSDTQALFRSWHFTLGLTVFTLVWVRLIARLASPTPLIEPPIARWQDITAKAVQTLLYVLMFAMPLLGWLTLSAAGRSIRFYGWQLPALINENKDLVETIKEIHGAGAATMLILVGIHAAAALYHHYVVRDNTLRRMLPW